MIYSITEGQQAEEYKARKAKEAEDDKKADDARFIRRYMYRDPGDRNYGHGIDDFDRSLKAHDMANREYNRRTTAMINSKFGDDKQTTRQKEKEWLKSVGQIPRDAANRHMRRHPDQYKESFLLTEGDADEFLESIGVALYEDFVTIGEYSIPGVEAEGILEEYGIFLYEEGIIIEGQQAEEYKARKAREAEAESKKYDKYKGDTVLGSRIGAGNKSNGIHPDGNGGFRIGTKDDNSRDSKSTGIVYKDLDRRRSDLLKSKTIEDFMKHASSVNNLGSNLHAAADATNRNIRRHPNQYKESCGIFSSVSFV